MVGTGQQRLRRRLMSHLESKGIDAREGALSSFNSNVASSIYACHRRSVSPIRRVSAELPCVFALLIILAAAVARRSAELPQDGPTRRRLDPKLVLDDAAARRDNN